MHRNILDFLKIVPVLFLLIQLNVSAADLEIKTLRIYSTGDETSFPVIDYSDKTKNSVTIEFDIDSGFIPNLNILFYFCDSEWNVTNNVFLTNPLYSKETYLSLDTAPPNLSGVTYHYSGKFPNNNIKFPYSGKWKFFIVDSHDSNLIYDSGRFFVVYPEVKLNTTTAKENLENNVSELMEKGRTISVTTNFTLPDTLHSFNVKKMEIVNNRKLDYAISIDRNMYTADAYVDWDAGFKFSFVARNILPGNYYRQTDIRDFGKYIYPTADAKFGEIETSNFFTKLGRDFRGGTYLLNYKNDHAEYINVVFQMRPPETIKEPVFLVGSFTDWKVLPGFEMYDDNGLMNISIPLKRGVYNYQYVTGEVINDEVKNIDWIVLEGNFYETENEYYIFLFYKSLDYGGYDKIIGYKKIKTGSL